MFDVNDFVIQFPDFSDGLIFNQETMYFVLLILLTFAGIMLCIKGYKYFGTLCTACVSILCGGVAVMLANKVTGNPLIAMSLFVIGTFLMVCLLYFLSILFRSLVTRYVNPKSARYAAAVLASVLGAGGLGLIIYFRIYRNLAMSLLLGSVILALSLWHGLRKVKTIKPFYTYDDLLRRKPLEQAEQTPEDTPVPAAEQVQTAEAESHD